MLNPRLTESNENASAPTANTKESWAAICRRLKAELGEATYSSWFLRLELTQIGGDVAYLSVPTKFLKMWIQTHYSVRILAAVGGEYPAVKHIVVNVRSSTRAPIATHAQARLDQEEFHESAAPFDAAHPRGYGEPRAAAPHSKDMKTSARTQSETETLGGSPLDRRLNFSTFIVGRSNQLAYASAQDVASAAPGDAVRFNPLYIHASVGLGKTHLLQATAHAAAAQRRRVIYLTAEKFMHSFASALEASTAISFKEKLRAIDVLIIDDVQFLRGKSIQQEFCHILNALIDAGRQIIIAADRPPGELEALEERVRSRLAGGLCVEMGALDEQLRLKMLEARVAAAKLLHPQFELSPAVLAYVASVIQTNGRDLDGAVNRLVAHASLNRAQLSLEAAERAIQDLIRAREPKRVKIEDIQKLVASHYNVSKADILSARRTANVVRPRQIAMFLAKTLTPRSLPEIGRRFGGRDHTTVLHAVRKIEGLVGTDGRLSEEIELLKRMLTEN
ncbi:MAG: chromosomal replication initiator protein DnaA [Methylovirgula sp.]|uniref:chromosomal replication initiator protein DnaA n=1 Tax=Methylovirgula sp. TaxID=1978224 RepID=UPI0030767916